MKIKRNQVPASVWRNPVHFVAVGLGTGASPYAPGTVGTLTDAMSAVKYHVFEEGNLSMAEMLTILAGDFEDHERERQLLLNRTPRYGNDDDRADDVMVRLFEAYFEVISHPPSLR